MNCKNYYKFLVFIITFFYFQNIAVASERKVAIGSKEFSESRLLGEILATLIENQTDIQVERRYGLGGTSVCFEALQIGAIDMYVEYTGTGLQTLLKEPNINDPEAVYNRVKKAFPEKYQIEWLPPLGFNNTYVLAMQEQRAQKMGIQKISDLKAVEGQIRWGFSHGFLAREDGFPGLKETYNLNVPQSQVRGLQHGLAYSAITQQKIDVIDAYSTDGKLKKYHLTLLKDDKHYFPPYYAAPIVRQDTLKKYPELKPLLSRLEGTINDELIQALNFQVEENGQSYQSVAAGFLNDKGLAQVDTSKMTLQQSDNFWGFLWQQRHEIVALTSEHLKLTGISVCFAALIGVPLGIFISRYTYLANMVLGGVGILQTIPSIALLLFMLPIFGIGTTPAVVALILYALLPIVRNTYAGLKEVSTELIEAGRGIGLTNQQILVRIELPLATKVIMAGIRTATVITIGTATLAAFIGAGGLGEPIVTGLALLNIPLVLSGAIPAATLALLADFLLGFLEQAVSPRMKSLQH